MPTAKASHSRDSLLDALKRPLFSLLNVHTGAVHVLRRLPCRIGSGKESDLRLSDSACLSEHAFLSESDGQVRIAPAGPEAVLMLDGAEAGETALTAGQEYGLRIGTTHFVILAGAPPKGWPGPVSLKEWILLDPASGKEKGPFPLARLAELAGTLSPALLGRVLVSPSGSKARLSLAAFVEDTKHPDSHQSSVGEEAGGTLPPVFTDAPAEASVPSSARPAASEASEINAENGELTCPFCWQRFDKGDIMHIAVHETLRGDPVLGLDAPQRFHATRFNDRDQAIDAMGMACIDMACPHCRRKLHTGFLDIPHSILSIVGAPSAGKSYYLSIMIRVLQHTLYRQFGVVLKDADPAGNAALNAMKTQLFSASTPAEAILAKTQLEGEMYERLPRFGRTVAMPKPFIFTLAQEGPSASRHAIVFYDNAGEHFEPGIDLTESPGAQHVVASSAVFFLFDPTANAGFRKLLPSHPDPQLSLRQRLDQQDVLLTEMEVRTKNLLGLGARTRSSIPMAVLVGKCDVWLPLLGEQMLHPYLSGGALDLDAVAANSGLCRAFLNEASPTIVANAESFSSEVVYFPVSALGHSPMRLEDGSIAADPARIDPMFVEIPVLWALSKIDPVSVPSTGT
jgi:hypothetical protein